MCKTYSTNKIQTHFSLLILNWHNWLATKKKPSNWFFSLRHVRIFNVNENCQHLHQMWQFDNIWGGKWHKRKAVDVLHTFREDLHRFGLKHAEFFRYRFQHLLLIYFIFAINSAIYILFTLQTGNMMLVCNLNEQNIQHKEWNLH